MDPRRFEALQKQMLSGKHEPVPPDVRKANGGTHLMRQPLLTVPAGTTVSMRIVFPDNRGLQHYGLVWTSRGGVDNETARQEIQEDLVNAFLNLTLPIGEA